MIIERIMAKTNTNYYYGVHHKCLRHENSPPAVLNFDERGKRAEDK